jgi:hypothetical protein
MTKRWIAINVLLLGVACLLGWQLRVSIRQFNGENDLAKIQPVRDAKQQILQEKTLPQLAPPKNYLPAEFASIPEKNIFSESRTREEKTGPEPLPEAVQPLLQKPILVAVMILDDQRRAAIIDPMSPAVQERGRRAQIKRIGDVYQGYTIADIAVDHIVLESGARREIIPLHEGSKRGPAGKTAILSTRVVPFGGTVSGGAAVTVGGGSGAGRTAAAPGTPSATPASAGGQPGSQASAGQSRQSAPAAAQQPSAGAQATAAQPTAPQPAVQPDASQAPATRVIRSPFGDIYRPNPN